VIHSIREEYFLHDGQGMLLRGDVLRNQVFWREEMADLE
jgi:hypothetical protein